MSGNPPAKEIELALRKLPIDPERESRLPGLVQLLAGFAGKVHGKTPAHFLDAGRGTVARELSALARAASRLADAVEGLHAPTVKVLANQGILLTTISVRTLRAVANVAGTAKVPRRRRRKSSRGRLPNLAVDAVTLMVAHAYQQLTGKRATRVINWDSGKPKGPFFELVSDVFAILCVKANRDAAIRKLAKRRKRRKRRKLVQKS